MRQKLDDHDLEGYLPLVYRFALQLTGNSHRADDLTQDVMLRAWRSRRSLRDVRATRCWLLRITANCWTDQLRQNRRREQEGIEASELAAATISPLQQTVQHEDLQRTMAALHQLPERQRNTVYLHVCEQLSLEDVAAVLSISYAAAKSSLSAGARSCVSS